MDAIQIYRQSFPLSATFAFLLTAVVIGYDGDWMGNKLCTFLQTIVKFCRL